ncbi:DUF4056 domain-containing protein [Enterobacter asburiae]|uniref:DUF4056 domain-containing protein n=1 Tax=Scandinavium sp. UTDF21-P1B TaxID=3446379 RepID=UPI003487D51D
MVLGHIPVRAEVLQRAWPVTHPLPQPDGLRPCCAFGYDLHAEVMKVPVPFYQFSNVVTAWDMGEHHYNDSLLLGLANLVGIGSERNGILYTSRGGFIDTAHIRDTADMTLYIFSQLLPQLGQPFTLSLDDELTQRRLVFRAFTPPTTEGERYLLAVWIAAHLAFQLAAWHEIAQWYGFESVPGFPEEVSAFSPEDLYSNLLGANIAVSLIRRGQAITLGVYDAAMDDALRKALITLDVQPAAMTRFHFDMLDGRWWNSRRRVPEKYLVLRRNYDISDDRIPTPVPGERATPLRLHLPHCWHGFSLDMLAQLELWPGRSMARLPMPELCCYTAVDFARLAAAAFASDRAAEER